MLCLCRVQSIIIMDNGLIDSRTPVFGHPVPGSVMASRSRAGVLVDPMPLPGQPAPLRTGK